MAEIRRAVEEYSQIRHQYEVYTGRLGELINDLMQASEVSSYILEKRTKELESFRKKISSAERIYEDPMHQVTDLSGIRIILKSIKDIESVEEILMREFNIDPMKSVRKGYDLDPDQFGYRSDHFVLCLKPPRSILPEWEQFAGIWAEVQVRTVLQHAWALISHSFDYKSEREVPDQTRRQLFRVSALLEVADIELDRYISSAQSLLEDYKDRLFEEGESLELNVDSLRAFLEEDPVVEHWANHIQSLGVRVGGIGNISRDVEIARRVGIGNIGEIRHLLEKSCTWGEEYLSQFFMNTWGDPLPSDGISIDRNGIVTLFLIGSYLEDLTDKVLDREFGWGRPERATVPARNLNPKYTD